MNTVILMWNPTISSFRMDNYLEGLKNFSIFRLNWSVWDYEQVHKGDHFYMVRVGEGRTGILMSGIINSDPYIGKDWSGKGRKTHYVDLWIECMLHPTKLSILSTKKLLKELPDFDWTGGHSGRILQPEYADKLHTLWASTYTNAKWKSLDMKNAVFRKRDPHCLIEGIQPEAKQFIRGIEVFDECFGKDKYYMHDAEFVEAHYTGNMKEFEVIFSPSWCNKDGNLRFLFKNILNIEWDAADFSYVFDSRIYVDNGFLVAEFDDVYLSVCSKELEVSLVPISEN